MSAPQKKKQVKTKMLLENAAIGLAIGTIISILGFSGDKKRPALIIAGGICLLLTGVLIGADGLQLSGLCTNSTTTNVLTWEEDCVMSGVNTTCVYTNSTDSYTYIDCGTVFDTIPDLHASGFALMLILAGIACFFAAFNSLNDKIE